MDNLPDAEREPPENRGRVVLLTYGTRGDVEPFVALARALRRAGADALLAAPGAFRELAAAHEVPFYPLAGNPADLARQLVERAGLARLAIIRVMARYVAGVAAQVFDGARAACQGADCIVHSFLMTTTGILLARERNVPEISAQLFPVFTPTTEFAGPTFPELPLGPLYRRLTHTLNSTVYWEGGRALYTLLRRGKPGLPPYPKRAPGSRDSPRARILYAFSPVTIPRPHDWGPGSVITGYWFLDPPPSWRPPEELEAFIEAGDPPVYIGFGSMQGRRSHELISESIPAVRAAGMRAVLAAPESARAALEPPSEVHLCADVPHAWLFPRMAAIVHHAGAGTTGAALRAGRPSVVLPLTADQGFWARRVHRLGAAPPPLTAGRATAESLAEAIRLAVRDPAIRSRAMEIQERIDAEDGVGCAVREIARVISARQ